MNSICAPIPLIYAGLVTLLALLIILLALLIILLALLIILLALTAVFSSKPTRRKAAAEILRLLLPGRRSGVAHRDPSDRPARPRPPNP